MNTTSIMQSVAKESKTSLMRNIAKATGLLTLYLGVLSWQGITPSLVPFHIISGAILGLLIMALGIQAARAGLPIWIVVLAMVWGIGLGLFGIFQKNIFPDNQLLTQVLHLIGGIGAIGMSEILAVETKKIIEQ